MTSTANYRLIWTNIQTREKSFRVLEGCASCGGLPKDGENAGGLRIIYYLRLSRGQIWMLTLYSKNVREDIPANVLKAMKEAIEDAKDD